MVKMSEKFHKYAKSFFDTAVFFPKLGYFDDFSPAPFYLYCHSIELSLKALLLLEKEESLKTVKKFSHDLVKMLEKIKKDIGLSSKDKLIIKMVNSYYNQKGFEYYDPKKTNGDYSLLAEKWNLDDLHKISKKLLENFKTN